MSERAVMHEAPGLTAEVARFSCAEHAVSADRTGAATRGLIDIAGVALAGRSTPALRAVGDWVAAEPSRGDSVVWGSPVRRGASQAALLNGTAGHALDFDDACPTMPLHPGAVLWPAVLAVAERRTGPQQVVRAIDVGNAVLRAVAEALPMAVHYDRGWHGTATVGRVAAVAALAQLRGLDVPTARHALGIVASMAAGSLANFGTGTKPLHAGMAARDAVVATGLAERGLDAAEDQLEHASGFLTLFGAPEPDSVARVDERLRHWKCHWPEDWSLKRYPSCYGTHRAIDAALELRTEVDSAQIKAIEVLASPRSLRPLLDRLPADGGEAKFSLAYCVAATLCHGTPGIGSFTDGAISDTNVARLMRLVSVRGSDVPPDGAADGTTFAQVRVRCTAGGTVARLVRRTRGDARNPLSDVEVDDKFRATAVAGGYTAAHAEALLRLLRRALTDQSSWERARDALSGTESVSHWTTSVSRKASV